jgi:hypothetical protein
MTERTPWDQVNGRAPLDWELPALERGWAYLLERDKAVLAGLLPPPGEDPPRHEGRPVADLVLEFSGPVRRRTGTS